jgi:prepilin-type N-terminal cleavage/methylation domain-containing protein
LAKFSISKGFTLAELLIALAILGEIATFTIPKILASQQSQKFKAIGKETAAMVTGAYSTYQYTVGATSSTKMADLTPYMNYTSLDTSSLVDYVPTTTSKDCSSSAICYRLHSGAIFWFWPGALTFGGTSTTHALTFFVDPDGVYSGNTSTPGKSAQFFLYYNGRLSSRRNIVNPTAADGSSFSPNSSFEPDWFSW